MPALNLSVVQEKGQVTIPAEIRRKLGVKKGDLVAFIETEGGVLISPRSHWHGPQGAWDQPRRIDRGRSGGPEAGMNRSLRGV